MLSVRLRNRMRLGRGENYPVLANDGSVATLRASRRCQLVGRRVGGFGTCLDRLTSLFSVLHNWQINFLATTGWDSHHPTVLQTQNSRQIRLPYDPLVFAHDGVAQVATALAPIGEQLRREITATTYLQTDDTPITVLDERGGSYKGRLWTYLDPLGRQVVFDATRTHERDGPEMFLTDFRGALQADAYAGYDGLYRTGRVVEIGCWAHARRRFIEALMTDSQATLMVARIQQLYQVEHVGADLDPDARRALRQEQSTPLLAQIDTVRQDLASTVLPKSPLGDAVRYLTNQWTALQRFVDDGRLAIDNNRAENQLRGVAVGRKNWLFAGSFEGARRAALLLLAGPKLQADRRAAVRLPAGRAVACRQPSPAEHRAAHTQRLGRHLPSASGGVALHGRSYEASDPEADETAAQVRCEETARSPAARCAH